MAKFLDFITREDMQKAIDEIDAELAALPDTVGGYASSEAWNARREAVNAAADRLRASGLVIDDSKPATGCAVRWPGHVRATSTSGIEGALRNWQTAARKRLAA